MSGCLGKNEGVSQDDDNSPYTQLVEQMIAVFSAFYSRNLSSDTKRAKLGRARRGEFNGSVAPVGYTLTTKGRATLDRQAGLHVDTEVAPVVGEAFERYATGDHSDKDIADWLNGQHTIQQLRDGKKPVGKEMVRDMLQNKVYTGRVSYAETLYGGGSLGQKKKSRRKRMEWFEGRHEAIISDELFEACKAVRATMRRTFKSTRQMRTYILPDRVYCGRCIAEDHERLADPNYGKMRVAWYQRIKAAQYRCIARDRGYRQCGQSYIREEELLGQVVQILRQIDGSADSMARIEAAVRGRESNQEALEYVRQLKERKERVHFSWLEGQLAPDRYLEQMHELEAEIASMRPLDYDKLEQAADLITHFGAYWDQCSEVDNPKEARQQLMAQIVDRVFVYDERVIAIALHPDFGVILDVPDAAPSDIMTAVSWPPNKNASVPSDTRTQDGSDGGRSTTCIRSITFFPRHIASFYFSDRAASVALAA